ncbi:MAG: TonB-dependent receptor [Myxococcales bacterium]|nr:TonB-dependent receptor [Myxococcales bacterium]
MMVLIAASASGICLAGGRAQDLEELLEMDLAELGEVEVSTASKRAEAVMRTPATVRVITEEQIRERGYLTLEQALADLAGFQFRNTLGLNSYVFMRGVPNQNNLTLVLVDGVEINELNSGGFYGGGHFNLANVKRIEVVYGPVSALYGTNAVSGIINIITKDPEDNPGLTMGGAIGSFGTETADLQYAFYDPETRFGLRVSGMLKATRHGDVAGGRNDYQWSDDLELYEKDRALDLKLRYGDFLLGVNYQNRTSSSATYHRSVGTEWRDHGTRWNVHFLNVFLRHRLVLSENLSLQSEAYARETTVDRDSVREISDAGQFGFFRPNYLLGAEAKLEARVLGELNLVGGVVFEYEWLARDYGRSQSASPDLRPPAPPWPEMLDDLLLSAYAQAQYPVLESLELVAGLRFDHSSVYEQVLTPRAGAVFNWSGLTAKLLYGEAFRAPRPWDYSDGLGNADLVPERMRSLELSLAYLWRDWVRLEAALYWNRLRNLLEKETLASDQWRWINSGYVDTVGLEAGAEAKVGRLRAFANYSYTWFRDQAGAALPEISSHGANLGVGFRITDRIRMNLWGQVLGPRLNPKIIQATGGDQIDAALVVNASLSFLDFKGFDFQIIARNLFDEVYFHTSNLEADRFRQPQRTIMARAAYRF